MVGRLTIACVSLLAVLAFLVLFGSSSQVNAVTYKMGYSSTLSCAGPNGTYDGGTGDDSCVEDATYGPYGAGLHADLVSNFSVPLADPKYSNYELLATMGTPSTWHIAQDKEIPNGAYIGTMFASSTLALFGGACTTAVPVYMPMYDCSTDITDTIAWDEETNGGNLVSGHQYGLPAGCLQFPEHVLDIVGNVQPRARYYGFVVVQDGMPPTQLNFMIFSPEQLSSLPAPMADFADDLGYINFTVLDNPNIPATADSSLDEFCTPLATTTTLFGRTGGEGRLNVTVTKDTVPTAVGSFWTVGGEVCGNDADEDGDTRKDEMCGIVRTTNPAANSGIYGTGSHMAGGYSESYRDADGDTIPNNQDECPFNVDTGSDDDGDYVDDACDPTPGGAAEPDEDGDDWRNQPDNCPLVAQDTMANDADGDMIGDECDLVGAGGIGLGPDTPDGDFLNDFAWGAMCIGATDTDGDGWCDATENIIGPGAEVLSDFNDGGPPHSTPEYTGIDWVVNASEDPPGAAPESCTNYDYYDVNQSHPGDAHQTGAPYPGGEVDDDLDTFANANDPNCVADLTDDDDDDGVVNASDNCQAVRNPTQLDTDSDGVGDACDTNDDDDALTDTAEWAQGSDPKNVCDPFVFDLSGDGKINILDIAKFINPMKLKPFRPCNPPDDYSICEATYRSNP